MTNERSLAAHEVKEWACDEKSKLTDYPRREMRGQ